MDGEYTPITLASLNIKSKHLENLMFVALSKEYKILTQIDDYYSQIKHQ